MKFQILLICMAIITTASSAQEKIAFKVSFTEPQTHYADVEMVVSGLRGDKIDLKMPVWAPGSYLIREFAKNVEGFKAVNSNGVDLAAGKINKNTWRVNTAKTSSIKVTYRVYAFELSVRTSFVDESHAFLSPTGIFLYPDGKLDLPSTVTIIPHKLWAKISTGLEKIAAPENTFSSPNFDILFDSPIEVGNQEVFEFTAAGVNHEVAMFGGGNYDKEILKRDMAKVVHEQTKLFGVNPNKRYVFIVHNSNAGGGGLEHLNSTVLGATRNSYNTEAGHIKFLTLVSHEYFHLWNVKRLRPIALGPFNYDAENYTTNLWIAEGFTAYYEHIFTKRAGLISADKYLANLSASISTVENTPGNRVQSASEASFDAWIKLYRPNENSANSTISYYSKGSLIALIMDLEIINATKGKAGLDEVMKAMYDEYYTKQGRGYTDAEFKGMVEKIAGISFDQIYQDYVNGVKTIDYNKYLAYAGLQLVNDAASSSEPYLGISASFKEGHLIISQVSKASGSWTDGLNVNDEIISIDNHKINNSEGTASSQILKGLEGKKTGDKLKVTVIRDGLERVFEISLVANPNVRYRIDTMENPSAEQLAVRKRWLKL